MAVDLLSALIAESRSLNEELRGRPQHLRIFVSSKMRDGVYAEERRRDHRQDRLVHVVDLGAQRERGAVLLAPRSISAWDMRRLLTASFCRRRLNTGPRTPVENWPTGRRVVSSGWVLTLARSLSTESGDEGWSAWSSGLRSVGCVLSRGWRSGRSGGGRVCIGRRSAGRCVRRRRRAMRARRGGRSATRSGTRFARCCALIRRSRASGSGSF